MEGQFGYLDQLYFTDLRNFQTDIWIKIPHKNINTYNSI